VSAGFLGLSSDIAGFGAMPRLVRLLAEGRALELEEITAGSDHRAVISFGSFAEAGAACEELGWLASVPAA
jgi:hypothetical protein